MEILISKKFSTLCIKPKIMLLESHKRAMLTTETGTGIPVVQQRELP